MVTIKKPTRTSSNNKNTDIINEAIPRGNVLLIDESGENRGTMDREKALDIADEAGLDLVMVGGKKDLPVCKIMDYSKYRFDQQKKLKEIKRNQQTVNLKEIRLSPTIDVHDFNTKLKHAERFIKNGDNVKLSIRFYGRMMAHQDIGKEVMQKFIDSLGDSVLVSSQPKMEGRSMIAVLTPNTK